MNTGREVASGRLWRTKVENVKERVRVVLYCGSADCSRNGQLSIYEEGRAGNPLNKPSRVIPLHLIHNVQCLNSTMPSPQGARKSGIFRMSFTESQMDQQPNSLWGFMLLLQTGEGVELFAEAREEQLLWIKHLNLLAMYPYSPLPEEPRVCPIKDSFRARLNPANFDADSVWAVYILPEEVGSRIQALGMQYLTLQSALSSKTMATLKIISPLDMEPIVTWEATKMRRTGNLNNMMFIEIGRRCEGGPGLIWMCTTPADTHNFRETLQRFIFSGDGRPVVSTSSSFSSSSSRLPVEEAQYSYDRSTAFSRLSGNSSGSSISSGSSSFGVHAPLPSIPSKPKSNGIYEDTCEYSYATTTGPSPPQPIQRSTSQPHSGGTNILSSTPPPVNLSTHPSRKKQHKRCLSNPGDMVPPQSTSLSKQKSDSKDSGFNMESSEALNFDEDFQFINESMSNLISELSSESGSIGASEQLKTNDLDDVITMLQGLGGEETTDTSTTATPAISEDTPFVRAMSFPRSSMPTKPKRANSTSTCQPTHYFKHRRPNSGPQDAETPDDYVLMQPLHKAPQSALQDPDNTSDMGKPVPKSSSTSRRQNYDQLGTIEERSLQDDSSLSDYINYPLPDDAAKATPIIFQPTYQNFDSTLGSSSPPQKAVNITTEQPSRHSSSSSISKTVSGSPATDSKMQAVWDEIQNLENVLANLTNE